MSEEFGFAVEVDVRLRDIDQMGHVNNAVYGTYLETARRQYVKEVVGESLIGTGVVIANVEIDFRAPIGLEDDVVVHLRVPELGWTSVPMEYEIRADGELAAVAETLLVTYDREADEPKPLPDQWRERIAAHEELAGAGE